MRYLIHTYGCQMNVHESEKLAGLLEGMGATPCEEGERPDIVVFNTCCIRDNAERRALGNIGVVKGEKKRNPDLIIAVCGCMTQQDGGADTIKARYPYVDIVLGTRNISRLPEEIECVVQSRKAKRRSDKRYRVFDTSEVENYLPTDECTPVARTSYPNAWVNIIYGCNNFCTYCIVPYVRGREISRDPAAVLDEVRRAVDEGSGLGAARQGSWFFRYLAYTPLLCPVSPQMYCRWGTMRPYSSPTSIPMPTEITWPVLPHRMSPSRIISICPVTKRSISSMVTQFMTSVAVLLVQLRPEMTALWTGRGLRSGSGPRIRRRPGKLASHWRRWGSS